MGSSAWKKWVSFGFVVTVLAGGIAYVATHWRDFGVLKRLDAMGLLKVVGALLVCYVVGGFQLNLFLRRFGVKLPWHRWLGLYMTMTVGNYVTPVRGGTGMGAAYLKWAHRLDLRRFGTLLLGLYVLSALVNAILGLVGMGLLYASYRWVSWPLVGVTCALLAACVLLLSLPGLRQSDRPVWKYVVRLVNAWHGLFEERGLLWRALLMTFAQSLSQTAMYVLIYRGLGLTAHPAVLLTLASLSIIGSIVSMTPGSLGLYDAAVVGVPCAFGTTPSEAAAALLVYRATSLCLSVAMAGILSFSLRPSAKE